MGKEEEEEEEENLNSYINYCYNVELNQKYMNITIVRVNSLHSAILFCGDTANLIASIDAL